MHFEFIENSNFNGIWGVNISFEFRQPFEFRTPVAMLLLLLIMMLMCDKRKSIVVLLICIAWCKCYDYNQQTHSKIHRSIDTHIIKTSRVVVCICGQKDFSKKLFCSPFFHCWSKKKIIETEWKKNVTNNSKNNREKNQPNQ